MKSSPVVCSRLSGLTTSSQCRQVGEFRSLVLRQVWDVRSMAYPVALSSRRGDGHLSSCSSDRARHVPVEGGLTNGPEPPEKKAARPRVQGRRTGPGRTERRRRSMVGHLVPGNQALRESKAARKPRVDDVRRPRLPPHHLPEPTP